MFCVFLYLYLFRSIKLISFDELNIHAVIYLIILYGFRIWFNIYSLLWRYAASQSYLRLIIADLLALIVFNVVEIVLPINVLTITNSVSLFAVCTLLSLSTRIIYRYCFKTANTSSNWGKFLSGALMFFSLGRIRIDNIENQSRIPIAVLGAGNVGTSLVEELLSNKNSVYEPCLFLENDDEKINMVINGIPIYHEMINKIVFEKHNIKEVFLL